jgi:hypothetical protein
MDFKVALRVFKVGLMRTVKTPASNSIAGTEGDFKNASKLVKLVSLHSGKESGAG